MRGTDAGTAALYEMAHAWLAQDPDPETRAELGALIASAAAGSTAALADLHDRFDSRLQFGTAGLRGAIEAGPNRMNRVLVTQAAAGLGAYLLSRPDPQPDSAPSVVIGYDGRRNSAVFARDTAEVLAGAGIRALLLPRLLPTPVLAFAVRHLGTDAGVMVTASHNPPNDNGYKVYLGGRDAGSQIVTPADAEIAGEIQRAAEKTFSQIPRSVDYVTVGDDVIDAYVAQTAAIVAPPEGPQLSVVYTAMHGVGWETAQRVFTGAGFRTPTAVDEQRDPDPAFPTVAFPNPEEPGAMDMALATARDTGAALVIANDPDADRLAVAIPDAASPAGYRRLTGDEVGQLLGWRAAESHQRQHPTEPGTLACTIVSSPALAAVADQYGLTFAETLTGFKWVSRAPHLIFGYEEALGYLVNPDVVRDKDGISAAVAFLSLATELNAEGITIADQLERFAARFGQFGSAQVSIRTTDPAEIARIMARLRQAPPTSVGGITVVSVEDLLAPNGTGTALPPSDVVRIHLEDGSRVMVRPSGTEPKLKVYFDTRSNAGTPNARRTTVEATLTALQAGVAELLNR